MAISQSHNIDSTTSVAKKRHIGQSNLIYWIAGHLLIEATRRLLEAVGELVEAENFRRIPSKHTHGFGQEK